MKMDLWLWAIADAKSTKKLLLNSLVLVISNHREPPEEYPWGLLKTIYLNHSANVSTSWNFTSTPLTLP